MCVYTILKLISGFKLDIEYIEFSWYLKLQFYIYIYLTFNQPSLVDLELTCKENM